MDPQLLSVDPAPAFSTEAREGETVSAEFDVRNVTGEPVKLLGATSTCGCTVVTSDFPVELPPDGHATVKVRMTVGSPDSAGRFAQSATLFVNREGAVPRLMIEVTVPKPSNPF
jgi:hypothetical protein